MRRQEFIKNAAVGLAALAAGRAHGADAKGSKYRVAVIGRTGRGNYGHGLDVVWNNDGLFLDTTCQAWSIETRNRSQGMNMNYGPSNDGSG